MSTSIHLPPSMGRWWTPWACGQVGLRGDPPLLAGPANCAVGYIDATSQRSFMRWNSVV